MSERGMFRYEGWSNKNVPDRKELCTNTDRKVCASCGYCIKAQSYTIKEFKECKFFTITWEWGDGKIACHKIGDFND